MNNNTISGFHILGTENGNLKLNTNKMAKNILFLNLIKK